MDRRSFLKAGAALAATPALAAVAGLSPAWAAAQDPANIRNYHPDMRYRPHGLTGIGVSALGFGMLRLPMLADGKTVNEDQTVAMLRHAIDHGSTMWTRAMSTSAARARPSPARRLPGATGTVCG